jgi:hypothetical protein
MPAGACLFIRSGEKDSDVEALAAQRAARRRVAAVERSQADATCRI